MAKNLYQILGVGQEASSDQLRAAYARMLEREPPMDPVQRMAAREALSTLVHAQRRAAYDASLHSAASVEATPRTRGGGGSWLAAALALLVAVGVWWAMRPAVPRAPVPGKPGAVGAAAVQAVSAPSAPSSDVRPLGAEELFARVAPSVVRVDALNAQGEPVAFGSGVVVETGVVVTNCHVARRGAALRIRQDRERFEARVVIADEAHDLCKLSAPGLSAPPVRLGQVASLRIGQKVYAIGSPQGLDLTLSDGMVSSLRDGPDGTLVQTSAPISPGSSGGGLFDEAGRLVGIVTFQMKAGQNLNFALPVDLIASMAPSAPREEDVSPLPGLQLPAPVQPPKPAHAADAAIHGRWSCFGPLTGRGLDMLVEADGSVSGTFDGKPVRGRWALQGTQMFLFDGSFAIEEMNAQRMVLNKGQGRRMVCSR